MAHAYCKGLSFETNPVMGPLVGSFCLWMGLMVEMFSLVSLIIFRDAKMIVDVLMLQVIKAFSFPLVVKYLYLTCINTE